MPHTKHVTSIQSVPVLKVFVQGIISVPWSIPMRKARALQSLSYLDMFSDRER